jgi:hypothetical protein
MNKPTPVAPKPARKPVHYRATFSLPAPLAIDIQRLSKRLGVTQSAFLTEMLTDAVAAMVDILDQLPPQHATEGDVRRARGKSREYIHSIVAEAQQLALIEAKQP